MKLSDNIGNIQSLTQAATSVFKELNLPRTLQSIADIAREMLEARYAALGVPSSDGMGLRAFIASGIDKSIASNIQHEPVGEGLLGALLHVDKPIRLDDLQADPRSSGFCSNHPPMTSFLGVPIVGRNEQRLGNLYLCDRLDDEPFDEYDEQLLVLFASFAAIAIENTQLHQQLQAAALRNERDRIGMELHDGIIQEIYAVGMKLEIFRSMLDLNDAATQQYSIIAQNLNEIIDNIRQYIRQLDDANEAQAVSFQQQIDNLVAHFKDFAGIDVTVSSPERMPSLTDTQRHSLAQIIREGLANIARHAQAKNAALSLVIEDAELYLTIEDDGIGMDSSQAYEPNHYGLHNMERRVRRLKGFINIMSRPQHGTRIQIVIPLKPN
jgi:signal transduction histidine kinase